MVALSRSELRKVRRRIGMIFQEFNLVERLTVMENLLSGRLVPIYRNHIMFAHDLCHSQIEYFRDAVYLN